MGKTTSERTRQTELTAKHEDVSEMQRGKIGEENLSEKWQKDRPTDKQRRTDRQTDRQTDRRTDGQTDRRTDRQTDR